MPHVDERQKEHWFGKVKKIPQINRLLGSLVPGVPVNVAQGGHLSEAVKYGNHPGVMSHAENIAKKVVADVVTGRALVLNAKFVQEIGGIRLSPLRVIEEPKIGIIRDMTFAGSGNRSSVNEDTDFDCAPPCELGHVLRDISLRVLYLRQKHGPGARILSSRNDVREAYRQIGVYREGAPVLGYKVVDLVLVDLRLQFGCRNNPVSGDCFRQHCNTLHTQQSHLHHIPAGCGVALGSLRGRPRYSSAIAGGYRGGQGRCGAS